MGSSKDRNVDYHTTQILTGHKFFKNYTHKIGKSNYDRSIYCRMGDTVEHTLLECPSLERHRQETYVEIGEEITTVSPVRLAQEGLWSKICKLGQKRTKERNRLKGEQTKVQEDGSIKTTLYPDAMR